MLLAVDTSTRWVGLALYNGAQVLSEMVWATHDHHTVELAPALASLLERSEATAADIQAIGVALGPGSFTSLRIGLGFVKGIALARHIPIVGIPTLDVLAAAQTVRDLPLAAVLQAGRGRLAVAWYQAEKGAWKAAEPARVMQVDDLAQQIHKPTLVCGELTAEERQQLARKRKNGILATPAQSVRRPAFLAELAWKRWRAGRVDDPVAVSPIYLHIVEGVHA
ncbi:MAG: tRNA (adenosine(37)-N6)-threonylcarbamoyltransferase complex dimerization subunit type 1 TsaB [Chloroflexi bacterium]|nr:tRNA (adenosine(37)-N6)-threonylcarbamoyltransferase complex dimerization subunit type 1 TsaB [Chloroflexota bacterium]